MAVSTILEVDFIESPTLQNLESNKCLFTIFVRVPEKKEGKQPLPLKKVGTICPPLCPPSVDALVVRLQKNVCSEFKDKVC